MNNEDRKRTGIGKEGTEKLRYKRRKFSIKTTAVIIIHMCGGQGFGVNHGDEMVSVLTRDITSRQHRV